MSRPIVRTLGALALAAAVATSSTSAFAATSYGDQAFHAIKRKKATTWVGLSEQLRANALQAARSRPGAPKLTGQGGTQQSQNDVDLETDLICGGEWFITWDEDANGNPIIGTYQFYCGDSSFGIG
jgi:hypothetical protein